MSQRSDIPPTNVPVEVSPAPDIATPPVHHSFFWMLAGNGAFSLAQWARIAVVAKLASATVVGEFALALALAAPIFMLTNLQLSAVQTTDARHRYEFADFATLRLLCSALALLIAGTMIFLLHWGRPLAWVLAFALAADSLCDIFGGLQQKHERTDRLGTSLLLRATLSIFAFATVFRYTRSLMPSIAVLSVVSLLVLFTWDIPMGRRLIPGLRMLAWRPNRLGNLALFSLPLGIIMGLISLNVNIPRYALVRYSGRAELGIFVSLSYVVMAVALVANGLGQSVSARLSRHYAQGRVAEFRSLIVRLCGAGALLGAVCVAGATVFGRPMLALLYRPEYAAHSNVFLVLAATSGVSAVASFLGVGITAARAFRVQVWTMAATVATTAVTSLILVPRYGSMGAAIALLISAVASLSTGLVIVARALRQRQREHAGLTAASDR